MRIEVNSQSTINFAPSEYEEIIQNVRTIMTTFKKSIPMFREFGADKILDQPINIVETRITSQIANTIKRYEKRAKLVSIEYKSDIIDGEMNAILTIEV